MIFGKFGYYVHVCDVYAQTDRVKNNIVYSISNNK